MHELTITSAILDTVLNELPKDCNKVMRIDITLGDLSGIASEYVKYYFKLLSRGTVAEDAILTFEYKRSKFRCTGCGRLYERCDFSMRCPDCKSRGTLVESCTSVDINRIEVEYGD